MINECKLRPNTIQIPKHNSIFFQRDYFHRIATIDFNIAFQKWLAEKNYPLQSLFIYFNKQSFGEKMIAQTQIIIQGKPVEPDLIAIYQAQ
ncbi:MAG: hypothetical protein HQL46_02565 [Gammaproteobacteria bacterium]|nr:hypothetical protein [Gammaproteobacteria bacterium]